MTAYTVHVLPILAVAVATALILAVAIRRELVRERRARRHRPTVHPVTATRLADVQRDGETTRRYQIRASA